MRTSATLAVLVLLATAGCLGVDSEPATDGVGTATDDGDATTTVETTAVSGAGETTTQSPTATLADPVDGATIRYEELNPDQRDAFDAARDGAVSFGSDSPHVDAEFDADDVGPFYEHDYVRKNGTDYRILLSQGRLYASYTVEAVRTSDTEGLAVVSLENLSSAVRDEVRAAVEEGAHTTPYGKWDSLPEELRDVDAVRYQGETYDLAYVVGDYWADVLSVEPVDAG